MRADVGVVLDACVLLPMPLADTLMRLAEHPRLYLPRWTDTIMEEVSRNLAGKLKRPRRRFTIGKSSYEKPSLTHG